MAASNSGLDGFQRTRLSVIPEGQIRSGSGGSEMDDDDEQTDIEEEVQSGIEDNEESPLPEIDWARPYNAVPSDDKCSMWKLHLSCENCKIRPPKNSCVQQKYFDNLPVYGIWQCSGAREAHFKRIAYLNHLLSQSRLEGPDKSQAPEHIRSLGTPHTFEHAERVMDKRSRYSSSFVEWPEPVLNRSGLAMKHCARCHDVPSPFKNGEIPWLHMNLHGCREEGAKRSAKMQQGLASDVFGRDNRVAQLREVLVHFSMDRLVGPGGRKYVAKERGYHWLHLNLFQEEMLKHASMMHDMVKPWRRCASMRHEHDELQTCNQHRYNGDKWFVPGLPEPPLSSPPQRATRETGEILLAYRPAERSGEGSGPDGCIE